MDLEECHRSAASDEESTLGMQVAISKLCPESSPDSSSKLEPRSAGKSKSTSKSASKFSKNKIRGCTVLSSKLRRSKRRRTLN